MERGEEERRNRIDTLTERERAALTAFVTVVHQADVYVQTSGWPWNERIDSPGKNQNDSAMSVYTPTSKGSQSPRSQHIHITNRNYSPTSATPLIQCARPSSTANLTSKTEKKNTIVSSGSKKSVRGLPIPHPTRTSVGMTKSAIWMQLPIATPIARSNLPLHATMTAVVCSAAFEMTGMMMSVIHSEDTFGCAATSPSSDSTRHSAVMYASTVTTMSRPSENQVLSLRCCSSLTVEARSMSTTPIASLSWTSRSERSEVAVVVVEVRLREREPSVVVELVSISKNRCVCE